MEIEILAEFFASGNIAAIQELLHEDGKFEICDDELNFSYTDKNGFLTWIWMRTEENGIDSKNPLTYEIDQCMYCKIGNPVILIDHGKFPVNIKKPFNKEKLGLMIEINNDKVTGISPCGSFLHNENPYNFELTYKRKCESR